MEDRYFLVERDALSSYGEDYGSTREGLEALLMDCEVGEEMVVILGHIVPVKWALVDEE